MIAPIHQRARGFVAGAAVPSQRVIGACSVKSAVAKRIRKGTIWAKVFEGVRISSHEPKPPPITLVIPSRTRIERVSSISRLKPKRPPNSPGHKATVLVAFATFGSSPSQSRIGKVTSVPPPAIEFIIPPMKAAANMMTP